MGYIYNSGFLSRPEKVYIFIAGSYETDLEKIGGEWEITHSTVQMDNGASFVEGDIAEQTQPFMEWMATTVRLSRENDQSMEAQMSGISDGEMDIRKSRQEARHGVADCEYRLERRLAMFR